MTPQEPLPQKPLHNFHVLSAGGDQWENNAVGNQLPPGRSMVPNVLSLYLEPTSPFLPGYFTHSPSHLVAVHAIWHDSCHAAATVCFAGSGCAPPCLVGEYWTWCEVCISRTVLMVLLLSLSKECFYWNRQLASWCFSECFLPRLLTLSACLHNTLFKIWTVHFAAPLDDGWYGGTSV